MEMCKTAARRFAYSILILLDKIFGVLNKLGNFLTGLFGFVMIFAIVSGIPILLIWGTGLWKPLENPNIIFLLGCLYFAFILLKKLEKQNFMIETLIENQKEIKRVLEQQAMDTELTNWSRSKATE